MVRVLMKVCVYTIWLVEYRLVFLGYDVVQSMVVLPMTQQHSVNTVRHCSLRYRVDSVMVIHCTQSCFWYH
jgi:hypothetical protein